MKKISILKLSLLFAATFFLSNAVISQTVYQSSKFNIKLSGTSNIHDWEMNAVKGTSEATFLVDANGKITSVSKLSFTLPAKNLKSDHTAMDKNTYKALKTTKNPNISFVSTSATITPKGGNNYQLSCLGKMTIAGVSKNTELLAVGKYDPVSKSFTVTGVKKMKMTDYNVEPPKALLGTIKTGNDISIAYNLTFSK